MMTAFIPGELVEALDTTQGLRKDRLYQIVAVDDRSLFGTAFVTYTVMPLVEYRPPTMRNPIRVTNGHIVLKSVGHVHTVATSLCTVCGERHAASHDCKEE